MADSKYKTQNIKNDGNNDKGKLIERDGGIEESTTIFQSLDNLWWSSKQH